MKLILPIFFVFAQLLSFSNAFCQVGENTIISEEPIYDSKQLITFLKRPLKDSLVLVKKGGKVGIIDSTGQIVVPLIYDKIDVCYSLTRYIRKNTSIREEYLYQLRYLNELFYDYWDMGYESEEEYARLLKVELANPKSYLHLYYSFYSNPMFTAIKDDKWGVINKSNETILPFIYESLRETGYGIFLAEKEGKYGVLDSKNKVLVSFVCDTIILMFINPYNVDMSEVYGLLKANGKYGLINFFTKQVLLPKYDDLEQCYHLYEDTYHCGFSSYWGEAYRLTPHHIRYKNIHGFNHLLIFNKTNKYGLLNMTTMQEVTTDLYDSIRFKSGYRRNMVVCLNDKVTFLMDDNTRLHPNLYDDVTIIYIHSSLSYLKVKNQGLVGVYNEAGKNVLGLNWDDVTHVRQLTDTSKYECIVQEKGKFGVVNNDNHKVIPVRYDSIFFGYDNYKPYYTVYRNSKSKKIIAN